jgi:serine/threonine protein phosphatase PrpC
MQGWRIDMEDAKITDLNIDTDTAVFGVFDGHGGKEVALFVAKHFVEELKHNENYGSKKFDLSLSENFLHMDSLLNTQEGQKELMRLKRDLPDAYEIRPEEIDCMAGCTAVVAFIRKNQLIVANAGDSRCVLAKGGRAIDMTTDHKPDLPQEKERIQRAGGTVEEGRVMGNLNLSRSIGDLEYKRNNGLPPQEQMITAFPELKSEPLSEDCDFMVLACDGVWDIMSSQQCVDFIYSRLNVKTLPAIVEDILDHCLAPDVATSGGLGCDNMTCIIVRFKHPL